MVSWEREKQNQLATFNANLSLIQKFTVYVKEFALSSSFDVLPLRPT